MKKLLFTIFTLTFLILILVNSSYSQFRKDYKNGKYFYKFDYPADWEIKESPSSEDPSTVKVYNSNQAGVIIIVKNSKANRNRSAHDLSLGDLTNTVKKSYTSAEFVENEYGYFLEKPAIILKFTFLSPNNDLSNLTQYSFIVGESYICIQAFATVENYSIDESLLNSILVSFSFTAEVGTGYVMNAKYGFSMTFPYGWKTNSKDLPYMSSNEEAIMVADVNKDSQYETFTANDLQNGIFEDIIRQQYSGTQIIDSKKIKINGESCIYIRFTYMDKSNVNTTKVHYYLIKNSTLYIIECTSKTVNFSKYESIFDAAANTLKIN